MALPKVSKSKYTKLAKRDAYPDMTDLGKADNLLRQMRHGHGYDPLTELIDLARDKKTSQQDKIKIAMDLLGYTAGKIKSIQTNPDMGEVININISNVDGKVEKVIDIPAEDVSVITE